MIVYFNSNLGELLGLLVACRSEQCRREDLCIDADQRRRPRCLEPCRWWYDVGRRSCGEVPVDDVLNAFKPCRQWYNVYGRSCEEVPIDNVLDASEPYRQWYNVVEGPAERCRSLMLMLWLSGSPMEFLPTGYHRCWYWRSREDRWCSWCFRILPTMVQVLVDYDTASMEGPEEGCWLEVVNLVL